MPTFSLEPVVKTLSLNAPAARAFAHFTENIHLWWPLATHSLSQAEAQSVVFEAREGGRIFEIDRNGREREWGRVLLCEPPRRLVFSWVLEAPDKATEIEVLFENKGAAQSSLTLVHRGWAKRPDGAEWRGRYDLGWDAVLGGFAATIL